MSTFKLGKRAKENLTTQSINECRSTRCCERNCVRELTFNFIKDLREEFYAGKQSEQSKYLARILQNKLRPGRYIVNGKEVCRTSIHTLFKTGEKRLLNIQKMTDEGIKSFERSNKNQPQANENMELFEVFMANFIKACEPIPNKDGQFQAPLSFSKKMLLDLAIEQLGDNAPKKSTFYGSLKSKYEHLKFPRDYAFAKCSTCISLKNEKKSTSSMAAKEEVNVRLRAHYEDQRRERLAYADNIMLSRLNGSKFLTIAIDGMDQMKTRIIKLHPLPKNFDTKNQLPIHVTGVKVHGETEEAYIYIDANQVLLILFVI